MRRSEAEGSPNEVSREAVARGRATQVSPNSAYAKHLRSKPANKGSNELSRRSLTHTYAQAPSVRHSVPKHGPFKVPGTMTCVLQIRFR